MLDVHPPDHSIGTWRDFLIHILTITIGLLIALTLEGSAEWLHHRHLLRDARENLRQEIHDNQAILQQDLGDIRDDQNRMQQDLVVLRALRKNPAMQDRPHFSITWSSFNDSAWRTARDSGALGLMPYKSVQVYSDVYAQQNFATSLALSIFGSQSRSAVPLVMEDPSSALSAAEIDEVLHSCADTLLQLRNLEQVVLQLDREYAEASKDL